MHTQMMKWKNIIAKLAFIRCVDFATISFPLAIFALFPLQPKFEISNGQ